MTGKIHVEPHVDAIKMPDNLRISLMVSEHRKKFVKKNAPKMVTGAGALRGYVDYIKATK